MVASTLPPLAELSTSVQTNHHTVPRVPRFNCPRSRTSRPPSTVILQRLSKRAARIVRPTNRQRRLLQRRPSRVSLEPNLGCRAITTAARKVQRHLLLTKMKIRRHLLPLITGSSRRYMSGRRPCRFAESRASCKVAVSLRVRFSNCRLMLFPQVLQIQFRHSSSFLHFFDVNYFIFGQAKRFVTKMGKDFYFADTERKKERKKEGPRERASTNRENFSTKLKIAFMFI